MVQIIRFDLDDPSQMTFDYLIEQMRGIERPIWRYDGFLTEDAQVHFHFYSGDEKVLTTIMRRDDLYQVGFEGVHGVFWELRGKTDSKQRKQLIRGSSSFDIDYDYPSFEDLELNFSDFRKKILYLSRLEDPNADKPKAGLAFTQIAFIISEAGRFTWISTRVGPLANQFGDPTKVLKLQGEFDYKTLVQNWSTFSQLALKAPDQCILHLSPADEESIVERNLDELLKAIKALEDNENVDPLLCRKARAATVMLCRPNIRKLEKRAKRRPQVEGSGNGDEDMSNADATRGSVCFHDHGDDAAAAADDGDEVVWTEGFDLLRDEEVPVPGRRQDDHDVFLTIRMFPDGTRKLDNISFRPGVIVDMLQWWELNHELLRERYGLNYSDGGDITMRIRLN